MILIESILFNDNPEILTLWSHNDNMDTRWCILRHCTDISWNGEHKGVKMIKKRYFMLLQTKE